MAPVRRVACSSSSSARFHILKAIKFLLVATTNAIVLTVSVECSIAASEVAFVVRDVLRKGSARAGARRALILTVTHIVTSATAPLHSRTIG